MKNLEICNSKKQLINPHNSRSMNLCQKNSFKNDIDVINDDNEFKIKKKKTRNKFSSEEDQKLRELVEKYGDHSWNIVSSLMETRSQRQCRERWKHYLSCGINDSKKPWSKDEDLIIMEKYNELGPKWTKIAKELPGRSDLQVKLRYLKYLKGIYNFKTDVIENNGNLTQENKRTKEINNFFINEDIALNENIMLLPIESDETNYEMNILNTESIISEKTYNNLDFQLGLNLEQSNLITDFYHSNFVDQSFSSDVWSFK